MIFFFSFYISFWSSFQQFVSLRDRINAGTWQKTLNSKIWEGYCSTVGSDDFNTMHFILHIHCLSHCSQFHRLFSGFSFEIWNQFKQTYVKKQSSATKALFVGWKSSVKEFFFILQIA